MLCKSLNTIILLLYLCCFHTVEGAAPSFTVPSSTTQPGSVDENSSKDISILTVEGEDTDGEKLSFSLVSQTPISPPFLLDADSGLLITPTGLDAEFSLTYNFTFGVSDGTTTVNSVIYTVNINDINEFTPVFQGTPYNASLLDSVSNGYQVFDALATDADATATVTYSLISGNNPVTFSLDSSNGKITVSVSTQLNQTSTPSYSLIIQASDGTNTVNETVSITFNELLTTTSTTQIVTSATIQAKMDDDSGITNPTVIVIIVVVSVCITILTIVCVCWCLGCFCEDCYGEKWRACCKCYVACVVLGWISVCCVVSITVILDCFKKKNKTFKGEENDEGLGEVKVATFETISE